MQTTSQGEPKCERKYASDFWTHPDGKAIQCARSWQE
jgi:hypothetical protein